MTAKHTPGSWKVQPGEINIGPYNKGLMVGPLQYAKVHVVGPFEGALDEETRANARLIAAAPTMADAIRAAAQAAAVGSDADGAFARIPRALFDALENALDAATGEYSKETA